MRSLLIGLLTLGLLLPIAALRRQAAPSAPDLDAARDLLIETRDAYCAAPAMVSTMVMTFTSPPRNPDTVRIETVGGDRVRMNFHGHSVIALDGSVYIERFDVPRMYMRVGPFSSAIEGMTAAFAQFGGRASVPLQIGLLDPEMDADAIIDALVMGAIAAPSLTGYETSEHEGRAVHRLTIEAADGKGVVTVLIDDRTKLVTRLDADVKSSGTVDFTTEVAFEYEIVDRLEDPIAFVPGDRVAVSRYVDLRSTPVVVGDQAPDFTLATLDGEEVTLSDLRGSIVVLDFWATWCGPCRRALPLLSKFNDWVVETGQPVRVFAVDTWERVPPEQQQQLVGAYWSAAGYSMPTLLDPEARVLGLYGLTGLPGTFVIDGEGKVVAVHKEYDANMVQMLKADVAGATGDAG